MSAFNFAGLQIKGQAFVKEVKTPKAKDVKPKYEVLPGVPVTFDDQGNVTATDNFLPARNAVKILIENSVSTNAIYGEGKKGKIRSVDYEGTLYFSESDMLAWRAYQDAWLAAHPDSTRWTSTDGSELDETQNSQEDSE